MNGSNEGNSPDPKQTPDPIADPAEITYPTGWLDSLNTLLERAVKADIDTGC